MQLVAPDILAEARGLSLTVSISGLVIGLFLWIFGGRNHRFWLVLGTTLAAGVLGLYNGPTYNVQPLVAGLLLAVAAGVLALALVRVLAFVAGGLAAWVVVHAVAPTWDGPLVSFLAGGLLGLVLFRFWMMALTSSVGVLLAGYATLCLVGRLAKADVVAWAGQHGVLLNWACGGTALAGTAVQLLLDRRRAKRAKSKPAGGEEEEKPEKKPKKKPPPAWMRWIPPGMLRKAG